MSLFACRMSPDGMHKRGGVFILLVLLGRMRLYRYLIEWGVLTGTLLHESLPRYFALKEKGAFKGAGGGLQKAFMNGVDQADINAAAKMLNVRCPLTTCCMHTACTRGEAPSLRKCCE